MSIKIATILVKVATVELIEDNNEPIGKDIEHVDTLAYISKIKPFEFLSINLLLTPPQIDVGLQITVIYSTPLALEGFIMPIITFDKKLDQQITTKGDALLNSLLDPLEGLSMLNCGKLELGVAPDFQH
jgi:hypothetical protein